jgi:microcystin-dependent protein
MWVGTLNALITYDGGEVGAVSANTGPMWEEDTTYQGRSPMGPGNIPSADPAKNLTVGETCGSGSVTLTEGQGTPHIHGVGSDAGEDGVWMNYGSVSPTAAYNGTYFDQFYNTITRQFNTGNTSAFIITTEMLEEGTASEAHENTHPVIGTYIIKRTARVNYVGA